jgi:RecA/RadA recombinase
MHASTYFIFEVKMAKKKEVVEGQEAPQVISVDDIDKMIEKEFDDLVDMSKQDTKVKAWLDTGVYSLNYSCSKNLFGGIAVGRVTAIDGLQGTGKSLLAASVMKDPQVGKVLLLESEGGGSSHELLQFAGVDLSKVRIKKFKTFGNYKINKSNSRVEEIADDKFPQKKEDENWVYVEGLTRFLKRFINAIYFRGIKEKVLIVLDSLGNLMSVRELSGTKDMGARNIDINVFFRNFDADFEKTSTAFIFCNKLYTNIGNQYDPWKASGGTPVEYNPSLSIRLSTSAETDDVSEKEMKEEKVRRASALGSSIKTVRAKIIKSRFGTEFRSIPFLIDFSVGPARYSGLFTLCWDFGLIKKQGSRYTFEGIWGAETFYKKDFIELIRANEREILEKMQKCLEEREKVIMEKKKGIETKDIEDEVAEEESPEFDSEEMMRAMDRDVEKV